MGAKLLQPTLTAGEMAPALFGRVDINRYMAGLRRCRNFIVRPYGGVENRTGGYYCYGRDGADDHRVIPFVYSTEISYVLFFGDGYVRVLSGGAEVLPTAPAYDSGTTYALDDYVTADGVTYRSIQAANLNNDPDISPLWWEADTGLQFSSPYTAAQVDAIRYTQSADVLYLAHPDVATRELRRTSANVFSFRLFENKEGPFLDLNSDESIKVAASAVQGDIELEASADIFTANAVGSLFYLEPKNLGQLLPWIVGDRGIVVGDLRRSDGKTYRAVTVPAVGTWHETGPRQPIHENGRTWDGSGKSKTNGVDTWSVGIEWEFVDTGYGVVKITAVTDGNSALGTVTKRLPASVVGGVGSPANTWPLVGDGVTRTFAIAGAGYGIYAVTIGGTGVTPDPNYTPGPGAGGNIDGCPQVDQLLSVGDGTTIRAGDVVVGDWLELEDPETGESVLGKVTYSESRLQRVWRVVTSREVMARVSASAPIWVRGGGYRNPERLMGQEVRTRRAGVSDWDVVMDLSYLGVDYVQLITVGDRNFWVGEPETGELAQGFILHHNEKNSDISDPFP